jgi:hypothetical protein
MYNKHTTALYAAIISSIVIASVFAISFVQQAVAQGNMSSSGNMTGGGGNQTSAGGAAGKTTGGKMTGAGPVTGGAISGGSGK